MFTYFLSNCSPNCLPICLPNFCLIVYLIVHLIVCLIVCLIVHLIVHLSVYLFFCLIVYLIVQLFYYLIVYLFFYLIVCQIVYLIVHLIFNLIVYLIVNLCGCKEKRIVLQPKLPSEPTNERVYIDEEVEVLGHFQQVVAIVPDVRWGVLNISIERFRGALFARPTRRRVVRLHCNVLSTSARDDADACSRIFAHKSGRVVE